MKIDGLTARSYRVAELVAAGHTDKAIAAELQISEDGVEYHVRQIVVAWALDKNRNIRVQITRRVLGTAA